ncbi:MAG: hypothetical protein KIT31_23590 [Deltaproteobacteria bacterium]|nr:hypothetical protein [Deltaproteobacteria bacterium]
MRGHDELVAYLQQLPDDWDSWLVFADALAEAGDARGELLVLEHRLATHPDPDVRWEADVLADEWLEAYGYDIGDDNRDACVWFRDLAPVAARAPADLAPAFARPLAQLLALLATDQDQPHMSPVLALQRERVIRAMLAWIDRAFDGIPVPGKNHRTIHQAEAADNHDGCDRSRDHLGRWQDLPDEHLLVNQWALPHLDGAGLHYYAPAVMSFALRHPHHERDTWITQSFEFTLVPSKGDLRAYQESRFERFDRAQRAAIYAFTRVAGHRDGAAAWQRVFEAERDGERADWFDLFSPR